MSKNIEFISIAFNDLIKLSEYDPSTFECLYYNRTDECAKFLGFLENISKTGENILITGEAGVGKSSFIFKTSRNKSILEKYNLYVGVCDYQDSAPRGIKPCIRKFIEEVSKYCKEIHQPINRLLANTDDNIDANFEILYAEFKNIDKTNAKHPVIFIDDLDYAENEWTIMLKYIMPLAGSIKLSIAISARPMLISAIDCWDDRFSYYFSRNTKRIDLVPLNIEHLITSRLIPVIKENESKPIITFFKNLFSTNPLVGIAKRFGIDCETDLERIDYPFTKKHSNFIRQITNGNIREMFDIAFESFKYIEANSASLPRRNEDSSEKVVIGRNGVIEIFVKNENSIYKIINLNSRVNSQGNSLLVNVLEAVKIYRETDQKFYQRLGSLGHKKNEIDWAIRHLCDKSKRLIQPVKYYTEEAKRLHQLYEEYIITEKGAFYLEIITWDEYIGEFGTPGKSVLV